MTTSRFRPTNLPRIVSFWSLIACIFFYVPANAQTDDPFSIHVEPNLISVHAEVYTWHQPNAQPYMQCRIADKKIFDALPFSEPFTPTDCLQDIMVHDLGVNDFHLFEDGVEQKIESVRYEREPFVAVRDSLRSHIEWSHTPRGKWSTTELGTNWLPFPAMYFYRLAYIPSKPAEGKCHNIKVKVDRHFDEVYATDQYCYTTNPATDPLNGTKFGRQMETDLKSDKNAIIPLSGQASFVYTNAQSARVDVVLEFPWNRLAYRSALQNVAASIGVLGVAYKKDGTVATRFTDFACCSSGTTRFLFNRVFAAISAPENLPSRYETQIDLPAGADYDLRLVLSDGENFGRVGIPLKIDSYDGKNLAISSVVLCNRSRDAKVAAQESAAVNLASAYVPLVSNGLQFTPAAHTSFKSTDHLTAYFEIYEPLLTEQANTQVRAHVKILDAQTGKARFQFAPIDATPYRQSGTTTLAVAGDLPLAQLVKGNYVVEAQATDSAGRSTPVRSATFTLE